MQTANVNVPFQITGRHLVVTEAIKQHVQKKIEGLRLDRPRIIEAQVILEVKKHRHIAEVLLFCANHITIEAEAQSEDLYAAMDEVISKVARRMRKFKTRIMKQNRPRNVSIKTFNEKILTMEHHEEHHEEYDVKKEVEPKVVVESEPYTVKPMYVDEAIVQLEVSERDFILFTNIATEKLNMVYRRKDHESGFGLIEPLAG